MTDNWLLLSSLTGLARNRERTIRMGYQLDRRSGTPCLTPIEFGSQHPKATNPSENNTVSGTEYLTYGNVADGLRNADVKIALRVRGDLRLMSVAERYDNHAGMDRRKW